MATLKEIIIDIYNNLEKSVQNNLRAKQPICFDNYRTLRQLDRLLADEARRYFSRGALTQEGTRLLDKINRYYRG